MANPIKEIRRGGVPSDQNVAIQMVQGAKQFLAAAQGFLDNVDRWNNRAGGKDAVLDAMADLGTAGDVIDQFDVLIVAAKTLVDTHKDDGVVDRVLPIQAADITAAKTRRGV